MANIEGGGEGPRSAAGNNCHCVGAPVGIAARCHDDLVHELVAELPGQPVQMTHVGVLDSCRQLCLKREDAMSATLADEVDLVVPVVGAQMSNRGFSSA